MVINSLDKMESIVKRNKQLRWDGWDVVHFFPSDKAWSSRHGAFHRGRWYMNYRFPLTQQGWDIPERFIGQGGSK